MYRLNLQTTHQEQQEQQQSSSPSSQSHIFVPKEQIEQRQATTKAILSHNIILQKSSHDITTKTTTTTTKLNVLETNTTKTGGVTATPADLTLPHLIRICGTKSGVVAAAAAVASSTPTLNTHTININTDPLRVPLPRGETVCSSGGVEGENMTSDINNEKLSEQQQQNTFLRQSNDMDKISVVGRDATTSVVMAASIEDKLKYLAALKTESILNEIMTTTETITTKTITTATATVTTPTTHFKKRHSKNEALGIAIVGGVGVNSLENTKYLENMAADLSISKGSSTASTDAVNSSNAILSGAPTISLSMESKPLYASNVVVLSGDSLDGVSNGACLLAYEATKRPRLDSSPKHWLPTSSPVSGATCSSVPPLSPSSVSQSQSLSANMTNEYASPLSVGSYDAFSPGGKTGRDDLSPSSSLNGYATNENCDAKKSKKGPAPRLQEELCLVCGDRASGYHYNALTCEGCKGFFRRSVTKNASYCCKFGHACEMDMYMRRKCQECRLKKCLAVGMRPECVVPETQCIIKRREKKAQKEKDKQQASPMSNSNDFVKKEILELMSCEPPTHQTFPLLPDDVLAKCQARNIPPLTHNQLSVIYKLIWYQDGYEQPSEEDLKRIMSSPDEDETQHDMGFRHITEITILTVQLIVEFAKGLPAFTRIPQEDQITLLKACSSEVMMLRMARRYDYSTDSIFFANNRSYNRDTYKMAGVADNIEDLLHFCRQMYAMKVDNVEYALVTAIVIFSDRPGLEEAELVEAIQNYYIDTLRIYILNRHCGDPKSIVFFAKLLSILTELRTLGNQNAEMCFSLKLKNRKLPKFLEEIWDVHTIPPSVQSHIQSSNGQPTTNIQKPTLPESSTIQQQQQQQQQQNHHQQQQQQQHSHTQHSHTHVLTHNSTLASTSAEAQQQQMLHNIKVESSPLAPTNMSLSSNGSPIGLNGSEYSDVSPGMPMMGMVIDQDNLMGGDSGTGTAA